MIKAFLDMLRALFELASTPIRVVRAPLPPEIRYLTPADMEQVDLAFTEVRIEGDHGPLPAWHCPAPGNKWVVLVHGRGGSRVGVIDMLRPLHDMGYNTLTITIRNDLDAHPSPDGLDHLGDTEWEDLSAAVTWVLEHGGASPDGEIVLFGRSAGAAIVGQYLSAAIDSPLVDKVVLDNPVLDWEAVFMGQRPQWMPKWVARLIIRGNCARIGVHIDQFNLIKCPPTDHPPVLIIHAVDDDLCPIEVSRKFRDTYEDTDWDVTLLETIGGHAGGRFADQIRYMAVLGEWLNGSPDKAKALAPLGNHRMLLAVDR